MSVFKFILLNQITISSKARVNMPTDIHGPPVTQVQFEHIRGMDDKSGVALDDVYLFNGTCDTGKFLVMFLYN